MILGLFPWGGGVGAFSAVMVGRLTEGDGGAPPGHAVALEIGRRPRRNKGQTLLSLSPRGKQL